MSRKDPRCPACGHKVENHNLRAVAEHHGIGCRAYDYSERMWCPCRAVRERSDADRVTVPA